MSEPDGAGLTRSHGRLNARPSAQPRDLMAEPAGDRGWMAQIVTLFPEAFPGTLGLSLTGKALAEGLWSLRTIALREHGLGRHRNVDDTPAGGGAGLVIRPDVLDAALGEAAPHLPVIYMSPRGAPLTQARARALAEGPGVTLVCGRFEGVDERVLQARGIEEISIGDYVLTGGELAAQVLIDATVRLIPRVLGNRDSLAEESFSDGLLEHPQYTKPSDWDGRTVPEVLLSGNHAAIARWRQAEAERLTKERRPDLWRAYQDRHAVGIDPAKDRQLSGASHQSRNHREQDEG
ncbi:tRNA (guanosine(37)-N1)-methyltransferase TrmD [Paracoccus suum]|uniref:tRNA (guanine-N(1)-)-methyltransferase n=1 Tax=Paracoccus suum TaxID=2259340 RepID=A0A344PNT7_9RHOB|nr:tRNA (guanosine(37)-N1)-methyltransferase TrmD [Paracoccus suum]AXC51042.1 tRNA (guanosine(37)-N1)-methyltransferase TrmD [Paracoccus suum]